MNSSFQLAQPKTSNTDILDLNKALKDVLTDYVNNGVDISFDTPDPETLVGGSPTINVFLYDVHEDLQLNTSQSREYNYATQTFSPGHVNLCCNYIITYWGKVQGDARTATDNQPMAIMNQIINALINNRTLAGFSEARTRVMPPREELNSLGNFWQALGNKPRMVLNYSVTLPIALAAPTEDVKPVTQTKATLGVKQLTQIIFDTEKITSSTEASGHDKGLIVDGQTDTYFATNLEESSIELDFAPKVLQKLVITSPDIQLQLLDNTDVILYSTDDSKSDVEIWRGIIKGIDRASQQIIFEDELPALKAHKIRLERNVPVERHPGLAVAELQAFAYAE